MIYNSIRAIAFRYNYETKEFLLRYYLDREPIAQDYENVQIVIAEFISNFKFTEFTKVDGECLYVNAPINQLECLDGFAYVRQEI